MFRVQLRPLSNAKRVTPNGKLETWIPFLVLERRTRQNLVPVPAASYLPAMRPSLSAAALALATTALSASGQERLPPPATAFAPSITTSLGFAAFSPRYEAPGTGTEYSFGSSLAITARADYPLTRRLGFSGELMVAPLAKQRVEHPEFGRTVADNVLVFGFHAGLAGRLKPAAPVFFQIGGGLTMATKHAFPDTEGQPMEPHAGLTVGYDAAPFGRANLRVTYSARLALSEMPDDVDLDKKSTALDHVVLVGLRFVPSRAPVRRAGP